MPYISIHTFLAEGDKAAFCDSVHDTLFQSTPSLRKVTVQPFPNRACALDFNPHLPCGRWPEEGISRCYSYLFQSTPSLRKVTQKSYVLSASYPISIHTFLAEGDFLQQDNHRQHIISIHTFLAEGDLQDEWYLISVPRFQSTPSLRKVTEQGGRTDEANAFQSTPSLRKVTI